VILNAKLPDKSCEQILRVIQHSYSAKEKPLDNSPIESFHAILKKEGFMLAEILTSLSISAFHTSCI